MRLPIPLRLKSTKSTICLSLPRGPIPLRLKSTGQHDPFDGRRKPGSVEIVRSEYPDFA